MTTLKQKLAIAGLIALAVLIIGGIIALNVYAIMTKNWLLLWLLK